MNALSKFLKSMCTGLFALRRPRVVAGNGRDSETSASSSSSVCTSGWYSERLGVMVEHQERRGNEGEERRNAEAYTGGNLNVPRCEDHSSARDRLPQMRQWPPGPRQCPTHPALSSLPPSPGCHRMVSCSSLRGHRVYKLTLADAGPYFYLQRSKC